MNKLKTINIKGKNYVEVHTRLKFFREVYQEYTLDSIVLDKTPESIMIKAEIKDSTGRLIASGIAEEYKGSSYINKTSYVENCETSAWGRALGNFGIGLDTSVASANEVMNAIGNQGKTKTVGLKTKVTLEIGDDNWKKVLSYVSSNKDLGLPTIVKNLESKYNIKANVKKEISKHIK
jgi:hypothetical protein|tara:strand:+ start:835 stop:1368 length:534 start_codon:yes stop_codon:yes gene_type:complete